MLQTTYSIALASTFTSWDDDEQTRQRVCEFSPCPPNEGNELPYEVNIIRLTSEEGAAPVILTTVLSQDIDPTFDFGWFHIDLAKDQPTHKTRFGAQRAAGWPILGLAFGGNEDSDYSVAVPMQYKSSISNVSTP